MRMEDPVLHATEHPPVFRVAFAKSLRRHPDLHPALYFAAKSSSMGGGGLSSSAFVGCAGEGSRMLVSVRFRFGELVNPGEYAGVSVTRSMQMPDSTWPPMSYLTVKRVAAP